MTKSLNIGDTYHKFLSFNPVTEIELKELGDDLPAGYLAGWASTTSMDRSRDVVVTGAFDEAINEKGLDGPSGIKLLHSHDMRKPLGVIRKLETRNGNLWIEAQLDLGISYAKDLYLAAKISGGLNFSVGFKLKDFKIKEDANGRDFLLIERADLFEVSVVTIPDNEDATMTFVKGDKVGDPKKDDEEIMTMAILEKKLVSEGLVKSRNEAAKVTDYVKMFPELFVKQEPAPVAPPGKRPPVSAVSIKRVSDLVAKMQQILDPK